MGIEEEVERIRLQKEEQLKKEKDLLQSQIEKLTETLREKVTRACDPYLPAIEKSGCREILEELINNMGLRAEREGKKRAEISDPGFIVLFSELRDGKEVPSGFSIEPFLEIKETKTLREAKDFVEELSSIVPESIKIKEAHISVLWDWIEYEPVEGGGGGGVYYKEIGFIFSKEGSALQIYAKRQFNEPRYVSEEIHVQDWNKKRLSIAVAEAYCSF